MANSYESRYTGAHNDQYEVRITALNEQHTNDIEALPNTYVKITDADNNYVSYSSPNKPIHFNNTALPQFSGAPYHLVGIDAFADGGTLKWASVSDISVGRATCATSYLASRATVSGSSHAAALKSYFDSYKDSIPRNCLVTHYSSAYGNGSQLIGYWLSGYNSNPYGGFFTCHYNSAKYIGIQNGTYTEYELSKSATSSIRIKTNIEDIKEEEAKLLLNITPIHFDYKEGYGEKNQYGFIAEELEEKFPYPVYCPKYEDGEEKPLQSVEYNKFIPHLIKLVQIQQTEINELKKEIQLLKNK